MYIQKTIIAGEYEIVKKCFSPRYGRKAIRSANFQKTTDRQKEINKRLREENYIAYALANFKKGDWYITLTYAPDKRPGDIDAAHKCFTDMLQKSKRQLKRKGQDIMCLEKTEFPPSGAVHHHLVINKEVPLELIFRNWPYGKVRDIQRIYSVSDLKLFNYLVKSEGARHEIIDFKFFKTRNLKKPVIKRRVIKANSWRKVPKARKGFELLRESIINYTDEAGYDAQKYIIKRKE